MRTYIVDGRERYDEDDLDALLEYVCSVEYYSEDADAFDDYLNQEYSDIRIAGYTYSPAEVFYAVDPDAYSEAKYSWAANEADYYRGEYYHTIDSMDDGDEEEINGYRIVCCEEDTEEAAQTDPAVNQTTAQEIRQKIHSISDQASQERSLWAAVWSV